MASEGQFNIRRDILRENNLKEPATPAELISAWEIVMKNWKGKKTSLISAPGPILTRYPLHTSILHRSYDSFPFTVKDKFFLCQSER
ncbi:hypothetical protein ACFSQ7_40640 [Paenibacillus rhizoplanae]